MTGKLYIIGVGPGDPELITLKAINILRSADVIVCPEKNGYPGIAFQIAEKSVPAVSSKEKLLLSFPMDPFSEALPEAHSKAAGSIISLLEKEKSVALLTLGDPSVYSTSSYILNEIKAGKYPVEIVPGVTSFCAASARLLLSLASGNDPILVNTAETADFSFPGTQIIMKAGKHLPLLKEKLSTSRKKVWLVENCGFPNEKIYEGTDSFPEESAYFSVVIVCPKK